LHDAKKTPCRGVVATGTVHIHVLAGGVRYGFAWLGVVRWWNTIL